MKTIKAIALLVLVGMSMPLTAGCGASNMATTTNDIEVRPIIHVNVQPVNLAQSNANGVGGQEQAENSQEEVEENEFNGSQVSEAENNEIVAQVKALQSLRVECNDCGADLINLQKAIKASIVASDVSKFNINCERYVAKAREFNDFILGYDPAQYAEKAKQIIGFELTRLKLKHIYLNQDLEKMRDAWIKRIVSQQLLPEQVWAELRRFNTSFEGVTSLKFDLAPDLFFSKKDRNPIDEIIESREHKREVGREESAGNGVSRSVRSGSVSRAAAPISRVAARHSVSINGPVSEKIGANVAKLAATKRRNSE